MPNPITHADKPEIQPQCIITTNYHAGYHRVTNIYTNDRDLPLVEYIKILNENGTPPKNNHKTHRSCHVEFCHFVNPDKILEHDLQQAHQKHQSLTNLIKKYNVTQ